MFKITLDMYEKKMVLAGIVLVIIILIGINTYFMFFNNKEFKVIILNTSDEKMQVEYFIFQNSCQGYNYSFTRGGVALNPNGSYAFHFRYDKTFNVNKIAIRVTNYTYYFNPDPDDMYVRWNGMSVYTFPDGNVHDLLAVITSIPCELNTSNISDTMNYSIGNTNLTPVDITIVKIQGAHLVTKLNFSKD